MLWINIAWGILNLFPIWPLDGGQITGVILNRFNRRSGTRWTHMISLIFAGGLAIYFFNPQDPFMTIFFALFAWLNFQTLQTLHREYTQYGIEDSADWWKR
jgi:stage IV sporulation protein FB